MIESDEANGGGGQVPATTRLGGFAFALSLTSALVYFSSSLGIRNFVAFLVDGFARVAHLVGFVR